MKLITYKHTAHVHHHAAHHSHIHLHGLKLSHSWFLVSVVHVFTTLCGVLYARLVGLSRLSLNNVVPTIFGLHQVGDGIAVKEIIDNAIAKSKGGLRKLIGKKKVNPDGYLVLYEKDFS